MGWRSAQIARDLIHSSIGGEGVSIFASLAFRRSSKPTTLCPSADQPNRFRESRLPLPPDANAVKPVPRCREADG